MDIRQIVSQSPVMHCTAEGLRVDMCVSPEVLDFLLEHGNRPEFTFRFRWQKGSIAFWDNRSTKHIALGDTGPFRRLMRRVQICGDKPM